MSISGYLKKSITCTQLGYSCTYKLSFYQHFGFLQWLQKYWWKRKWNDISLATAFTQYILKLANLYFKKNKNERDFAPWSQVHNLATCNFQFWQLWQFSILTTFSFDNFQFWPFSSKMCIRSECTMDWCNILFSSLRGFMQGWIYTPNLMLHNTVFQLYFYVLKKVFQEESWNIVLNFSAFSVGGF